MMSPIFSSFAALGSPSPPPASAGTEKLIQNMLKTATSKDLRRLDVMPLLKFGAKIRLWQ